MKCGICEIGCHIKENGYGKCRMVTLEGGVLVERYPDSYSTLKTARELFSASMIPLYLFLPFSGLQPWPGSWADKKI